MRTETAHERMNIHFCYVIVLYDGPLNVWLFRPMEGGLQSIVTSVCLSVCLSLCVTELGNHTAVFVHVDTLSISGFVAVARSSFSDVVCTSGFVDDVMFSHNWLYGASCVGYAFNSTAVPRSLKIICL